MRRFEETVSFAWKAKRGTEREKTSIDEKLRTKRSWKTTSKFRLAWWRKPEPGRLMPGAHWSQHFESHDDLCTLGLAAAANDEVLSSLFTRGRHRSASPSAFPTAIPERSLLQAPLPAPEGRRDSARKDFVQEILPPGPNSSARPLSQGEQLALPRPVSFQSVRCAVSLEEASSSPWQQPSPSAHRRSSHSSTPAPRSSSATEIPSTLKECAAEIVRLRALLEAERVAVQVLRAARP